MNKHFGRALILAVLAVAVPAASFAQVVGVRIVVAPPVLPVYEQPICPTVGFLWTPGYWGYGEAGYYWVPGVWVQPPSVGLLWTPGYWGFEGPVYVWHAGYWGPHIGFYGGVNYGFGYTGVGFLGGIWVGSVFRYNTAVMHVGVGFHDVYVDRAAIVEGGVRTSFNGPGGLRAVPSERERLAERDHHIERSEMQRAHEHAASLDRSQRFSENHGRPANAAMSRPREAARAGEGHGGARGPANRAGEHGAAGRAGARPAEHGAPGRAGANRPAQHAAAGRAGASHPAEHGAAGKAAPGRAGGAAPHAAAGHANAAPSHANAGAAGHASAAHAPAGGGAHPQAKAAAPAAHAGGAPKGGGASKGGAHKD